MPITQWSLSPGEYVQVMDKIKRWPPEARLGLLRDVANSLELPAVSEGKRGRPAAELIGLGTGEQPPPDDERVREWIDEHRIGKHG